MGFVHKLSLTTPPLAVHSLRCKTIITDPSYKYPQKQKKTKNEQKCNSPLPRLCLPKKKKKKIMPISNTFYEIKALLILTPTAVVPFRLRDGAAIRTGSGRFRLLAEASRMLALQVVIRREKLATVASDRVVGGV